MLYGKLDPAAVLGRDAEGPRELSTAADFPTHISPAAALQDLPTVADGFRVICADPPWRFKSNSVAKPGRNPMRHYRCMELSDIAALPVSGIVADNAVCFLWVTGPFLAIGAHIPILSAWGFQPRAMAFEWAKTTKAGAFCFGSGHTTRKCVEYVVLGKRGRSVREHADISELIVAMRPEPSRKPDEFFARVERYSRGPYLEMFARQSRAGWASWGDQRTLFDEAAP